MGRNLNGQKWQFQIFSNNFYQKDGQKFGKAKIRHSKFIHTFLVLTEGKKYQMAKIGTEAIGIANRKNEPIY